MSTPTAKPTRVQLDELDALLQRMLSLPINQLDAELPPPPPLLQLPAPPPPKPVAPPLSSFGPLPAPPQPPRPMMPPPAATAPPPVSRPLPRRRAEPPTGNNVWNIPLPPGVGTSPIPTWPAGIDALNATATSSVNPQPGKLHVTTIPSPDEDNRTREVPPAIQRGHFAQAPPPVPTAVHRLYAPSPAPMPAPLPPAFPPPSLPFYLWPLGALDQSIAGVFSAFGPLGRWVGQGGGKTLVGWCGLLMLAAAIAWGVMDYLGMSW